MKLNQNRIIQRIVDKYFAALLMKNLSLRLGAIAVKKSLKRGVMTSMKLKLCTQTIMIYLEYWLHVIKYQW